MAKQKLIKLSKPSLVWALLIIFGAHHLFESGEEREGRGAGCLVFLLSVILIIPAAIRLLLGLYYASIYWQFEGIYFDSKSGDVISKDFDEPEGFADFLKIIFSIGGREWISVKKMPGSKVNDFTRAKLLFGYMNRFSCGSSDGKSLLDVIITNPKQVEARIKKKTGEFSRKKNANARQQKIKNEARHKLDVEDEVERQRATRAKG